MTIKLLTAAALLASLAVAPALAQTGSSGTGDASGDANQPVVETDQGKTSATGVSNENWTDAERSMYGEGAWWSGFYTDNTMSTLKADADVQATFSAMGAEDQAGMKAACDRVKMDQGSYGSVTQALCAQVGQL